MIRCPLVLERLNWDAERAEVTYQARAKRSKGPSTGITRWDVLEFIARITDHIPEPGQQLVGASAIKCCTAAKLRPCLAWQTEPMTSDTTPT